MGGVGGFLKMGNSEKFVNAEENLMSAVIQDLKGHWSKLLKYLAKNVFFKKLLLERQGENDRDFSEEEQTIISFELLLYNTQEELEKFSRFHP